VTVAQHVQQANDDEVVPRANAAVTYILRLLTSDTVKEADVVKLGQGQLVLMTQQLVMESERGEKTESWQDLQRKVVGIGRWLVATQPTAVPLTPEFALLVTRSALLTDSPDFALTLLPHLMNSQQDDAKFTLTGDQKDAFTLAGVAAVQALLKTGRHRVAVEAIDSLRPHGQMATAAHLLNAIVASSDGRSDAVVDSLKLAETDDQISPELILSIRCLCDRNTGNWTALSADLTRLDSKKLNDRQTFLVNEVLGPRDSRRLTHMLALLQLGQTRTAVTVLQTLRGSGLHSVGYLVQILHELEQRSPATAAELLLRAQESGVTGVELVIADVAVRAAEGSPLRVADVLGKHLLANPTDSRVRMLLARWHLSANRQAEALQQYRSVVGQAPEELEAWTMSAILHQQAGQKEELKLLLSQMHDEPAVARFHTQLSEQLEQFAVRMRTTQAGFQGALSASDLLRGGTSRAAADWNLMVLALRASKTDNSRQIISQMESLLPSRQVVRRESDGVLKQLDKGLVRALSEAAAAGPDRRSGTDRGDR
jgi:hypothetical protein